MGGSGEAKITAKKEDPSYRKQEEGQLEQQEQKENVIEP